LRAGPLWLRTTAHGDAAVRHRAGVEPQVGYTVTRAAGSAVDRNRIRRRLRAAVARHSLDLEPATAYLFGGDRRLLHAPFASIDRAVGELLRAASEMNR